MPPSIAVLGSLHLDIVVHAPRLPLLGETLMGQRWTPVPGGKGLNQAVACARAGVNTRMLGATGTDERTDLDGDAYGRARELLDEIRRRSGETDRSEVERDYLKRLLDRF